MMKHLGLCGHRSTIWVSKVAPHILNYDIVERLQKMLATKNTQLGCSRGPKTCRTTKYWTYPVLTTSHLYKKCWTTYGIRSVDIDWSIM